MYLVSSMAKGFDNDPELVREYKQALSLVDGAKPIIELWDAETPAQKVWKEEWIKNVMTLTEEWGIK